MSDKLRRYSKRIEAAKKLLKKLTKERNQYIKDHCEKIVADTYWNTSLKVVDISKKFFGDESYARQISASIKPRVVCSCSNCGSPIIAINRTHREQIGSLCAKCKDVRDKVRTEFNRERNRREREAKIQYLRSLPYSEYLKTSHWQNLRANKLRYANFRCQLCNSGRELNVHHKTYERKGCEWYADLIVLCGDCHETFHENRKLAK